jgi:(1->4)-alpha-D-glucan 1-alpha-D-glucosylmutase
VRARIAVLSEIPAEWEAWLKRWRKLTSHARTDLEGETAPSANEEYLYYQTLLGTWPVDQGQENDAYVARIQRYMLKAIKEAKVNSSWIQPNEDWENALRHYVEETLKPQSPLCSALLPAAEKVAWHGMLNSLSQTILKLTCPGVPDFYQGSELWDLRLVDPDNRDPVDYAFREKGLARIEESDISSLFKAWKDGLIKLAIVRLLLQLRQREPRLFQSGIYSSLYATGSRKDCCVAFHRRLEEKSILVIVPRLTTKLGQPGESPDWDDTQLLIDESLPEMQDLFSKGIFKKGADQISLKSLGELPFAVFHT